MMLAEYCKQKVAPAGSAFYYSVRRLSPKQRNAIIAIMAFYKELEDITLEYADLSIAHVKLNWWRDEVIKIQEGMPTHPIALQLKETLPFSALRLIEIIDGLEQNLTLPRFEKFEDVIIHLIRTAGKRELLIADVLQVQIEPERIYQFALVIELTHYIQFLRRFVKRGLIYFAEEELQKFSVTQSQLHDFKTTPNCRELLLFQVNKIKTAYVQAQQHVSLTQRNQLANIFIRCEIACAVLDAIDASEFAVLENFIDITPLRRWWIAWKT